MTNKERSDRWQDLSLCGDFWRPGMAYLYRGNRHIVPMFKGDLVRLLEEQGRLEADLTHPGTVGFLKEEARDVWPDNWFNIDIKHDTGATDIEVAEYVDGPFAVLAFATDRQETEVDALLMALEAGIKGKDG